MKDAYPRLRNDDVLQVTRLTKDMRKTLRNTGKTLFELFLESDKIFAESNYPCILVILSEGIDVYPEWVEHIKKNQHRYIIELHGRTHYNHSFMSKDRLREELSEAKKKIEDTFQTKVTTWYTPFGRKGENIYGEEVCKELGIIYDKQTGKIDAKMWFKNHKKYSIVNFHFWKETQVELITKIINLWQAKDTTNMTE